MKYNYIIVGAGISGCIIANILASKKDASILLIDKRTHIAGNCFDYFTNSNICVHKYGPHIFHTNNDKVWMFLSQFTDWIDYQHRVLAKVNDSLVPVPFNLTSIKKCFPFEIAEQIISKLLSVFPMETKIPILDLKKENDDLLRMLADFVYEKVFLGYTIKQWDMKPEELDASVTARIPVFISEDDRYFQDKYQGIPKEGYTRLMEKMIDKPNIVVLLETDYFDIKDKIEYDKLFYSGMIDEFYGYCYGKLPYRSLRFDFEESKVVPYQPVAQVNHPCDEKYTRITEFIHFQNENNKTKDFGNFDETIIAKEFSLQFTHKKEETPYYPIPQQKNFELFKKYNKKTNADNIVFLGRLADYSYYNMDQAVEKAMKIGEEYL